MLTAEKKTRLEQLINEAEDNGETPEFIQNELIPAFKARHDTAALDKTPLSGQSPEPTQAEKYGVAGALFPATTRSTERGGGFIPRAVSGAGDVLTLPARAVSAAATGLGTLAGGGGLRQAAGEAARDLSRTESEEKGALGFAQNMALDPTSSPLLAGVGTSVRAARATPTIGKALLKTVRAGAGYGAGSGAYQQAKEGRVEAGQTIGQALLGAGVGALGIGAGNVLNKAAKLSTQAAEAVKKGVNKGIKPSVSGKYNVSTGKKFENNVDKSVKSILEDKNRLNIVDESGKRVEYPKNITQFDEAIPQEKQIVYEQYHNMAVSSGKRGVTFNPDKTIKFLNDFSSDVAKPKELRDAAINLIPDVEELRGMSPQKVEERLKYYNDELKAFYNRQGGDSRTVAVKEGAAQIIRKSLDDDITSAMGKGYQELKNKYGALSAIEKDVHHRALIDARRNAKGLADFADIGIVMAAADAFTGGGASAVVRPILGFAAKEQIKHINNPNTHIRRMFDKVNKVVEPVESWTLAGPEFSISKEIKIPGESEVPTFVRKHPSYRGSYDVRESRALPPPLVGEMKQKISDIIPTKGQRMRNIGESGSPEYDKPIIERPGLPSPEDIKKKYPNLTEENFRPIAYRYNEDVPFYNLPENERQKLIVEQAKKYRITPQQYEELASDILRQENATQEATRAANEAKKATIEQDVYLENLEKKPVITIAELRKKENLRKMEEGKRIKKSGNKPGDIAAWHELGNERGAVGAKKENPQVHTENFKQWFGDWKNKPEQASKVVDENGEPLVVYHGTGKGFTRFDEKRQGEKDYGDRGGKGFYFTKDSPYAAMYGSKGKPADRIVPVFLSIKNPLNLDSINKKDAERLVDALNKNRERRGRPLVDKGEYVNDLLNAKPNFMEDKTHVLGKIINSWGGEKVIKEAGFDGVISLRGREIAAYYPNQIKSATGNSGAFSKTVDDIRGSSALKTLAATGTAAAGGLTIGEALKSRKKK